MDKNNLNGNGDVPNLDDIINEVLAMGDDPWEPEISNTKSVQGEPVAPVVQGEKVQSDRTVPVVLPNEKKVKANKPKKDKTSKKDKTPKKEKKKKKPLGQRYGFRTFVSIITVLIILVGGILGACAVLSYGPSETARNIFVASVLETSALKFMAHIYFSDEEIADILSQNSVEETTAVTDTSLVHIEEPDEDEQVAPIVIEDVSGGSFKGKMMIISDPSRVFVGTSADTYTGAAGLTLDEIIDRYGAVGGVNGGGFADDGGVGNGGTPLGIVISEGELKWGSPGGTYEVIGIDEDNKLVVGTMTGQEALDMNIRDALTFGPALIVNGEITPMSGQGGGLNPRTAIGQTSDGTILLLTCDGRQTSSLGASLSDLTDVMISYGAVNAANLDGGSSTLMYYEGEMQNSLSSVYGARNIPTAFIVAAESEVAE